MQGDAVFDVFYSCGFVVVGAFWRKFVAADGAFIFFWDFAARLGRSGIRSSKSEREVNSSASGRVRMRGEVAVS